MLYIRSDISNSTAEGQISSIELNEVDVTFTFPIRLILRSRFLLVCMTCVIWAHLWNGGVHSLRFTSCRCYHLSFDYRFKEIYM